MREIVLVLALETGRRVHAGVALNSMEPLPVDPMSLPRGSLEAPCWGYLIGSYI